MIEIPQPYYDYINLAFWLIVLYFVIAHITFYLILYLRKENFVIVNPYKLVKLFTCLIIYRGLIHGYLLYYIYYYPLYKIDKYIRNKMKYRQSKHDVWYYNSNNKRWYMSSEWPIILYADENEKDCLDPTLFTIDPVLTKVEVYKSISKKEFECISYTFDEYVNDIVIPEYKKNNYPINYISKKGIENIQNFMSGNYKNLHDES